MLCVECGKKEIFKDGVCVDCYRDTHSFANGPQIIDLPVCSSCNSYKYKNTWTDEILGDVLRRVIKNNFQISRELKKVDINTNCNESKQELKCKVFISGFIEDVEITEEHDLLVRLKYTVCDVCSKQYGGYYESIVQIRTDKRKLTEDELKDIEDQVFNQIEEIQRKGNRSLFVTDYGLEHGGLDFYLSDKNTGLLIVKKIQEKYGGTITQSSKNIGMKDSRQVYRNTYLIRIPDFKTYDIIKQKNDFFLIKSIHGNKTKIVNLKTWEETSVDIKIIEKSIIAGGKDLVKEMILVSQNKNEVQVMDEKNYQIQNIRKPKSISYKQDKIKIIKIDEQLFLFPN